MAQPPPIAVEVSGLDQFLDNKTWAKVAERPIAKLLNTAALIAERTAREGAPSDTGALKRSLSVETRPLSARVFSVLPYAIVMEQGRRAGARMPPPSALAGWARRHPLKGGGESSLFALARSIGRRGIKGRFFMKAAKDEVDRRWPTLLDGAAREIADRWKAAR